MLIAATETQIDAYHAHVGSGKASQQCQLILEHIKKSKCDWSIGEIEKQLGLEKSTCSARINELLYDTKELIEAPKRKDKISGKTIRPVTVPPIQGALFQ